MQIHPAISATAINVLDLRVLDIEDYAHGAYWIYTGSEGVFLTTPDRDRVLAQIVPTCDDCFALVEVNPEEAGSREVLDLLRMTTSIDEADDEMLAVLREHLDATIH